MVEWADKFPELLPTHTQLVASFPRSRWLSHSSQKNSANDNHPTHCVALRRTLLFFVDAIHESDLDAQKQKFSELREQHRELQEIERAPFPK